MTLHFKNLFEPFFKKGDEAVLRLVMEKEESTKYYNLYIFFQMFTGLTFDSNMIRDVQWLAINNNNIIIFSKYEASKRRKRSRLVVHAIPSQFVAVKQTDRRLDS